MGCAGRGEGGRSCDLTDHTSPELGMEGKRHLQENQEPAGVVGTAAPEDVVCSARGICTQALYLVLPSLVTWG